MALARDGGSSLSDQLKDARAEVYAVRGEVSEIASEMQRLLQMQMELASAEMSEAKSHVTKAALFGSSAAVFAIIGDVFLFLAIMFALDTFLETWLAALITMLIAFAVTAIFALVARQQMKRFSPAPKRFMRSVQEDMQWAKTRIRLSVR